MFDWLFGRKPIADLPYDDRVWVDGPARMRAVLREATARPTLLVAVYEASEDALAAMLGEAAVPFVRVGAALTPWSGPLVLVRADNLRHLTGQAPQGVAVLVFEHPPMPAAGRALREALATYVDTKPVFFSAVDEPLMRRLGGERAAELMRQLGLGPDEPVEHAWVSRSLANAREKVSEKVRFPRDARSIEEWIELNLG
jgi:hypothetical protein